MTRKTAMMLVGSVLLSASPVAAENITFTNWFYGGALGEAFEAYNASFMAENPDVSGVDVETIPFPRYHDVINVRLASGTPPDVAFILAGIGPSLMDAGRLMDLTPFIEAEAGYDLDDFGPAITPWIRDGRVYALPFTNASNAIYYNIDLFEAAGLPTPDEMQASGEWTWENLARVAEQLQEAGGARFGYVFGNGLFTSGWQNLVDIFPSYGGGPWSEDGTECGFDDAPSIAALQLVHDMIYRDGSHPQPGVDVDFATGDIGMSLTRPTFAFRLDGVPFRWDIITAPEGPEGFVPSRAQNILVTFTTSENAELGARYVVHATNPENAALWTASAPPRLSLQTLELMAPNNALSEAQLQAAVIPAMQNERFQLEYSHRNYGPLQSEIQRLFSAHVWNEDADLEQATAIVCNQIAPFLR